MDLIDDLNMIKVVCTFFCLYDCYSVACYSHIVMWSFYRLYYTSCLSIYLSHTSS